MSAEPSTARGYQGKLPERKRNSKGGVDTILPFERRIVELEDRLRKTESDEERQGLEHELQLERDSVYPNLSAWERVLLARHAARPRMLDYTTRIFDDLIELHGDRAAGDDPAIVAGIARFQGRTVMTVGQQKGVSTEEKVARNFGMAHPSGYRKALRIFDMAERFGFPVITFVDTPAAHPGVEAEKFGQGPAIAKCIMRCLSLKTPILSVVLGEGGSGGALAIAAGDRVAMFEHSIYVICPPERCAEILWRDVEKKQLAASALKVTAQDLYEFGVIDTVLPEPNGGAHRNPDAAAQVLAEEIERFLHACDAGDWSPARRQDKFQRIGVWVEEVASANEAVD